MIELVQWLVVILAMLLIYRSVPAHVIRDGIDVAKRGAAKTDTSIDDLAIETIEDLFESLWERKSKPADDSVDDSVK